jgi:hypothetical protein
VRGARVDNAGGIVINKRHCFPRRVVREAEKNYIRLVRETFSFSGIFSLVRIYAQQFQIGPLFKPLVNFESCGAFLTVDKNLVLHGKKNTGLTDDAQY